MSDVPVVYATTTTTLEFGGAQYAVQGGSHWYADDPLVRANPSLFSGDARYGMNATVTPAGLDPVTWERVEPPAEQATAAPGEVRSTRRRTA